MMHQMDEEMDYAGLADLPNLVWGISGMRHYLKASLRQQHPYSLLVHPPRPLIIGLHTFMTFSPNPKITQLPLLTSGLPSLLSTLPPSSISSPQIWQSPPRHAHSLTNMIVAGQSSSAYAPLPFLLPSSP